MHGYLKDESTRSLGPSNPESFLKRQSKKVKNATATESRVGMGRRNSTEARSRSGNGNVQKYKRGLQREASRMIKRYSSTSPMAPGSFPQDGRSTSAATEDIDEDNEEDVDAKAEGGLVHCTKSSMAEVASFVTKGQQLAKASQRGNLTSKVHEASWADHPLENEGIVHVGVSCLIKSISQVQPMTGSFLCQLGMKVVWNDPRMVNFPETWELPEDLWCPNVMMPNALDVSVRFRRRYLCGYTRHRDTQCILSPPPPIPHAHDIIPSSVCTPTDKSRCLVPHIRNVRADSLYSFAQAACALLACAEFPSNALTPSFLALSFAPLYSILSIRSSPFAPLHSLHSFVGLVPSHPTCVLSRTPFFHLRPPTVRPGYPPPHSYSLRSQDEDLYEGAAGVSIANREHGMLEWHRNVLATFSCSFDLRKFPFDENQLAVRFNSSKLRDGRATTAKDVQIHAGMHTTLIKGLKKDSVFLLWSDRLSDLLDEYQLLGVSYSEYVQSNCSFISWSICVRRRLNYYFTAVIFPLSLTSIVTFSSFFCPPNDMSSKIEVLIGCFAAVIAFLFVINDKLPKTPYRHKIDKVRAFEVRALTVHVGNSLVEHDSPSWLFSPSLLISRYTKQIINRTLFLCVFAVACAVCTYLVYDHCDCVQSYTAYDPDVEAVLELPLCRARNNGTGVRKDATCTAMWVSYIWLGVQVFLCFYFNIKLFLRDTIRWGRRAKGFKAGTLKPKGVPEWKTYVPQKDIIKINIWRE